MGRIALARAAVLEWSCSILALREQGSEPRLGNRKTSASVVAADAAADILYGVGTGLVMNPAQAPAFFARSSSWRCTGCREVHVFERLVSVAFASPCRCAGIEFEPLRELAAASNAFPGLALAD